MAGGIGRTRALIRFAMYVRRNGRRLWARPLAIVLIVGVLPQALATALDQKPAAAGTGTTDLTVDVADGGVPLVSGGTGTFSITVRNGGTAASSGLVTVNLSISGATMQAASGSGWSCNVGNELCTNPGPVPAGGSLPAISVSASVPPTGSGSVRVDASVANSSDDDTSDNSASIETPITTSSPVDLTLSLEDGGVPLVAGGTGTDTITVSNAGTAASSGLVSVNFSLSGAAVDVQGASGSGWNCNVEDQLCTNPGSVSAGGALPTITLTTQVANSYYDDYGTEVSVSASVANASDGDTQNNRASITTPVTANVPVNLTLSMAATSSPFVAGGTGAYSLTVSNFGTAASSGLVTVNIPEPFDTDAASGSGWNCDISSATCTNPGPVPAGGSLPAITVSGPIGTGYPNEEISGSASVSNPSDDNTSNDSASAVTPIIAGSIDLSVNIADGGSPFVAGGSGSDIITVHNSGTTASSGLVTVNIPEPFDTNTASGSGWSCDIPSATCTNPGPVPAGGTLPAITVSGPISSGSNSVSADTSVSNSSDDNTSNDSASIQTNVEAPSSPVDLTLSLEDGGVPLVAGGTGTDTITVSNAGTAASSGLVSVNFSLSGAAVDVQGASGSGWNCNVEDQLCTNPGSVSAGGALPTITLTTQVANSYYDDYGTEVSVSASVANASDGDTQNNRASITTPVTANVPVNLTLSMAATSSPFVAGGTGAYSLTVSNFGTAASSGLVTVNIPEPFDTDAASGSGWNCDISSATCTNPGPVPAGGSLPAITVSGPIGTGYPNEEISGSASVSNPSDDNTSNDSASAVTPIIAGSIDLSVNIADGGSPFVAGGSGSDIITVHNSGTTASSGLVTVNIPEPFDTNTASGSGWSCDIPSATCTNPGPVPAGGTLPAITVSGPISSGSNSVSADTSVSNSSDDNTSNDSASIQTNVETGAVDLSVNIADLGVPFVAGGNGLDTATVHNTGTAASSGLVIVSIAEPYSPTTAAGTGWSCDIPSATCTSPGPVPAGGSLPPITIGGPVGYAPGGAIGASASVSNSSDTDPGDTSTSITTPVTVPAGVDLGLSMSAEGAPFSTSSGGDYSVTVFNAGSAASSGTTTVQFSPSTGQTASAASGNGWSCGAASCTTAESVQSGDTLPPIDFVVGITSAAPAMVEASATVSNPGDTDTANDTATADAAVAGPVDLTVNASDEGQPFVAGGTGSYSLLVRNTGPQDSSGLVTLSFSTSSVSVQSATGSGWSCNLSIDLCSNPGPVPANGSLPVITVNVAIPASGASEAEMDASVSNESDGEPANGSGSITTPITAYVPTDLTVDVADGGVPLVSGGTGTFSITVRNGGTAASSGLVTVNLSISGATMQAASGSGWSCNVGNELCTNPGPVPAGGSLPAISVSASVPPTGSGSVRVDASVANSSDDDTSDNSASIETPITTSSPVDLTLSLEDGGVPLVAGGTGTDTITVSNAGTAASSGLVSVNFSLSGAAVDVQGASGSGWNCNVEDQLCTNPGSVSAGGALPTITLTTQVANSYYDDYGTEVSVSASVANASDGDTQNNRASITTPVTANVPVNLTLSMAATSSPFVAGGTGAYSLTVSNFGTAASSGLVTVNIPEPFDTDAASGSGWNCDISSATCTNPGPVPAGGSLPAITVSGPIPSGSNSVQASASVSNSSDDNISNDSASVTTAVTAPGTVDLTVSVASVSPEFTAGSSGSYTVTVRNLKGKKASTGTVTVDIPEPFSPTTASGKGWTCKVSSGTCTNPGSVASKGSLSPITVSGPVGTNYPEAVISASASVSNKSDANTRNNSASASTPIVAGPVDLNVHIADSGAPFLRGATGAYALTVHNSGTKASSGTVTVDIPQPFTPTAASGKGWTCNVSSSKCTNTGAVAADGTLASISVTGPVPSGSDSVSASASVTNKSDSDTSNNYASMSSNVVTGPVDLSLTITDGGQPFMAGGAGTYTIIAHNSGTKASSGTVTMDIPEPFTPTAASGSGWKCNISKDSCTSAGPVPAGGSLPAISVTGPVQTSPGTSIFASASISNASDDDPYDTTASIATPVISGAVDVSLDITDDGPFGLGGVGLFIVTVRNVGGKASSGLTSVNIPEPFDPTDAGGSGWSCDLSTAVCTSSTAIAPGAALPVIYVLGTVPSQGASTYSGSASVTNPSDTDTNDNTASITTAAVADPPQQPLYSALIARSMEGGGDVCFSCLMNALIHPAFGDPVDSENGNMYTSSNDISIPGRGYQLAFTRTYNSNESSINGPLGYGWTNNLGINLVTSGSTSSVGSTATVTEENGAQTVFTYDGTNWDPPSEAIATLSLNSNGTWTMTRDAQQTLTFNSSGQITAISDLNGYTTTFTYTNGQLTTVTDQAGRTLTLQYSGAHISSVTDPNVSPNRVVSFTYDSAGDLTQVTDVNGGTTDYTYNSSHQMLTDKDPNCVAASSCPGIGNQYDSSGRVTSQSDDLGRTTAFTYAGDPDSAAGGSTTVTDPLGNVTVESFQYGLRVSETQGYGTPQAATTQYRYDPATGQPIEEIDPNGNVTGMAYDTSGNMLMQVDALGRVSQWTYNDLNEPLTSTDPKGVVTTNTYDARGNLTSVSTPCPDCSPAGTQLTKYVYGNAADPGDLTSMIDPDSNTWTYTYDNHGDRTSTEDPLGNTTTSTYNADGWLLASVSPKGNVSGCGCAVSYTTTYSYVVPGTSGTDEFGDVQTVTDPLNHVTTYGYDADRNRTLMIDPSGNRTAYSYDLDDELTQTTQADGSTLTTDYNADGTIHDEKNGSGTATQTFGYDSLGRETSVTDALGNATTYTYDPDGNQLTLQQPGGNCSASVPTGCTSYSYDADNELTGINYSDGTTPDVSDITYDADGQRIAMTDGSGTWNWAYNSLHELTSATEGSSGAVSYEYDMRGLVTQINYPDAQSVSQGYSAAGQMTSVTDGLGNTTKFKYDQNGNLTTETAPSTSAVVDTFGYNDANQMTSTSDARGSTSLFSATYTRSADGQLTSDSSATAPNGPTYGYNSLNQLCYSGTTTSTQCPGTSVAGSSTAYSYDSAEDLVQNGASTQSFNAADQLCWTVAGQSTNTCSNTPSSATTFTYNAEGDRTLESPSGGSPSQYGYDEANQMTSYTAPSGTATTYAYNGDGLRTEKNVAGTTTQFAWDTQSTTPLLLQQTTGGTSTDFVYGPGGLPLEQVTGSTVSWLHHDQLGSTRIITNSNGSVVAKFGYSPSGSLVSSTGSVSSPLLYGGQYFDSESGLYYLRARYYDPSTSQFTTEDPDLRITGQPYEYAGDNPLNLNDPLGLFDLNPLSHWRGIVQIGAAVGVLTVTAVCVAATFGVCSPIIVPAAGLIGGLVSYQADSGKHTVGGYIVNGTIGGLSAPLGNGAGFAVNLLQDWYNDGGQAGETDGSAYGRSRAGGGGTDCPVQPAGSNSLQGSPVGGNALQNTAGANSLQ